MGAEDSQEASVAGNWPEGQPNWTGGWQAANGTNWTRAIVARVQLVPLAALSGISTSFQKASLSVL